MSTTLEEVASQDYILTPGIYVGIAEQKDDTEPFEEKMTRLLKSFMAYLNNHINWKMILVRSWQR